MTVPLLEKILAHCCGARSLLCMFQVQDLLDLDDSLWDEDPEAGRINVPGTVNDQNWTWRMPLPVEQLSQRPALRAKIRALSDARRQRPVEEITA